MQLKKVTNPNTCYNTLHVAKMLKITTTSYRGWSVSGMIPSFSALWLVLLVSETLREMNDIEMGTTATRPTDQLSWQEEPGLNSSKQNLHNKSEVGASFCMDKKKPRYPLVDVKISVQYINGSFLQLSAPHWADQPPSNSHGEHAVFIPTPALYLMFVLLPRGCKPAEEAAVQDLLKSADVTKRGGWACVSHLTFSHILSSFKTLGVHRDAPLRPVKSW